MARKYDIIERLKAKNERPIITVDADHCFTVNTSKTNVLEIMALQEKMADDAPAKEQMKAIDQILILSLGQSAADYINSMDLSFEALQDLVFVIFACIGGQSLEDVDKLEGKAKKK